MDKIIKLAGIAVEIHTMFDSLVNTDEYETDEAPLFTVTISEEDIIEEQKKSIAEAAYEGINYPGYSPAELENTAVYRKIAKKLPEYNAFVFHGSAVAVNDKAYLFTAKSGTGKTTHTNLWLKNIEGSYIVNGDKPVLRIIDGKPFVCGTPWMGKEKLGCNKIIPLHAVCFLGRGEANIIKKVDFSDIFPILIGQAYRPPDGELVKKTVSLLEKVSESVCFYKMLCNMKDEAAFVSFRGMSNGKV